MYKYKNTRIIIKQADITKEDTDAIVNAANTTLLGGGGVDGAIHRAGGSLILDQCKKIGGCPTGESRITVAGNLPSRYVIHTVGPIYGEFNGEEGRFLYSSYINSLKLGDEYELKTIAFPSISTGAYGYPIDKAVKIALKASTDYIDKSSNYEEIRFILYSDSDYKTYKDYFEKVLV